MYEFRGLGDHSFYLFYELKALADERKMYRYISTFCGAL